MGLIMVIGIVAKNGILLLDADQKLRGMGHPKFDAMILAGERRLRPILMTALATIAGMIPLSLGLGAGSQMLQPLAIAVIEKGREAGIHQLSGALLDPSLRIVDSRDNRTVAENVAFGLMRSKDVARKDAKGVAVENLAKVGLGPDVAELSPAELSGGMRKRVGLARAIATEPEIIFFDEPTTGLDPIMADVINELIVKCVKELGATALSITHDMASARKIADRIAMIWEGKIIWHGPVSEIDHSGNPYVDQFIHGRADGPIKMQIREL